jgi:PKD repeat protein
MSRRALLSLFLVFFSPLVALGLAIALLLGNPMPVLATPPIEGNTHDFNPSLGAGDASGNVLALAAGDIDNNGTQDVAYADGSSLVIQSNDGTPFNGWSSPVTVASAGHTIRDLVLVDFDRDGHLDLAAVTGDGSSSNQVTLWRNPGTSPFGGTWSTSNTLDSGLGDLLAVAAGDLDNDGWLDLVVADASGALHLWRNPLAPFTTPWTELSLSGNSNVVNDVALADLNGDGALDLVTIRGGASDRVQIWRNDDTPFTGSWTPVNLGTSPLAGDGLSLALGDWDCDGDTDVASGDSTGNVILWQNPGATAFSGTWSSGNDIGDAAGAVNALIAADLDDDGDLDLVSGAETTASSVRSWQNPWQGPGSNGPFSGAWSVTALDSSDASVNALAAADFDNDYDIDIIYGQDYAGSPDELQIIPNTLVGRQMTPFSENGMTLGSRADDVRAVLEADLDGDGDLDVVAASRDNAIVIWENDGTPFQGTWPSHMVANNAGSDVFALVAGDLDNDGDIDLVSGQYSSPYILAWENSGNPFGGAWTSVNLTPDPADSVQALALTDLDNDGDLDLVSGTGEYNASFKEGPARQVILWENLGTPFGGSGWGRHNIAEVTYAVLAATTADLDADGNVDIIIGLDRAAAAGSPDPATWPDVYQVQAFHNDGTPFSGVWAAMMVGRDPATASIAQGHEWWGAPVFSVKAGDLDNDGDLDLITGDHISADYQLKVWENDGTPFSGELWRPTAIWYDRPDRPWMDASAYDVDVGDINQDGYLDVLSGSGSGEVYEVKVWENSGSPFGAYITDTTWIREDIARDGPSSNDANMRSVVLADLDRDSDLDILGGTELYAKPDPDEPARVMAWQNRGGSVAEVVTPQLPAPARLDPDATGALLRIVASHRGRVTNHALELAKWYLHLADGGGNPLTSAQANARIESLAIYYSTDGNWSGSDTLLVTIPDLALTNGVQTISFADGDSYLELAPSQQKNYFVVVTLTSGTPNSFQIIFDADADSAVEDKTTDTSVIVQDTGPVSSGVVNNIPPEAVISGTYTVSETVPITFDGSASSDANNDPLIYSWQFGDGGTGSGPKPAHAYAAVGTYGVTLTVEDTSSLTDVATTTVTVQDMIPVAEAGGPYAGLVNQTITLNGSQSQGDVKIYRWDLNNDGSFEKQGVAPTTQFTAEGTFTVTLKVEDDDGGSSTDKAQVIITSNTQWIFLPLIVK